MGLMSDLLRALFNTPKQPLKAPLEEKSDLSTVDKFIAIVDRFHATQAFFPDDFTLVPAQTNLVDTSYVDNCIRLEVFEQLDELKIQAGDVGKYISWRKPCSSSVELSSNGLHYVAIEYGELHIGHCIYGITETADSIYATIASFHLDRKFAKFAAYDASYTKVLNTLFEHYPKISHVMQLTLENQKDLHTVIGDHGAMLAYQMYVIPRSGSTRED